MERMLLLRGGDVANGHLTQPSTVWLVVQRAVVAFGTIFMIFCKTGHARTLGVSHW